VASLHLDRGKRRGIKPSEIEMDNQREFVETTRMKQVRFWCVVVVVLLLLMVARYVTSLEPSDSRSSRSETAERSVLLKTDSVAEFSDTWEFVKGDSKAQSTLLNQAEKRRDQFMKLMAEEPAKAIEQSISLKDYVALPPELKPYFERPLNAIGNMDLQWEVSMVPGSGGNHGRNCHHANTVTIENETLKAYGADRHMLPVMNNIPISGIRLGDVAVVRDSSVSKIAEDEVVAATTLFPIAPEGENDPITHRPATNQNAALIAGQIYQFETSEIIDQVDQTLTKARNHAESKRLAVIDHPFEWLAGDSGGDLTVQGEIVDETPYLDEQIDVLFIRVDFSDFPGEPVSKSALESTLSTVNAHLQNYSYNKAGLSYTVTNSVYRMPDSGATYALAGDNDGIQTDAQDLASADYTIGDYDVIAVFFPNIGSSNVSGSKITYGGLGSIGGSNHWVNGSNSVGIILHEFGHNYGMYHANYYHPEQELGGIYQLFDSLEYGDIFDEMGKGDSPEAHFSHLAKNYMQWMPDSKVAEATGGATYTIYRFDDINALSNPLLAVKVPMSGDVNYWIGYRQLFTSSSYNLSNAAYVVAENLAEGRETSLIDMTPESKSSESNDRKDAGLPVGGTYYDSNSGVRFNALEKGGSEPNQWIKVQIVFDPRVSLAETDLNIDEQGGTAQIVVQRKFSSSGEVSVNYSTSNGSAISGSDYYAVSGSLTWPDGDLEDKTIIIPIRPDVVSEGVEDFTLTLSNVIGGKIDPGASTVTVSLLDAGQRVTSFFPPHFNITVRAIAPLADGRVMIGGDIYGISGYPDINNIARLYADGSVDTAFVSGSGFDNDVECIVVQSDGKYLVGGVFTSYNGINCNHIIRLNADGSVDNTFLTNMGSAADGNVICIAIESDDKILVGGEFDNFKGGAANGLVRLNTNGSPATALATPLNSGAVVQSIIAEPDGKIIAGGNFSLPNTGMGTHRDIVRLNSVGSRDTSFEAGSGSNGGIYSVARQADGKYILVGYFNTYNGVSAVRCCRANSNGSLDNTFSGPAFDNSVLDVLVQANGKTVVAGWFTSPAGKLERLTSTGASDSTFMQGSGPAGGVYELAADKDGYLWVGGNFFSYNGSSCRPVIRLAGGETPYDVWAKTQFSSAQFSNGESASGFDSDGDGIINLAEMAMGTNPNVANSDSVFSVSKSDGILLVSDNGQQYLQISLDKTSLQKGAWFLAQFSNDLNVWNPSSPTPATNASYEVIEDSATRFIVRDKTPTSPATPRFGRILIKQPE
jgi:uncharacterized delta-60 repeat protein